jgi:hypothetical protein
VFKDFKLHLEYREPFMPHARGQQRGNSGVYLQNRYEIQVLDSFGLGPSRWDCAAFYELAGPTINMCFPPLSWQTYDIEFKAARYGADGKKTANAVVTVHHNGVRIHDNVKGPTLRAPLKESDTPGPILLQNMGSKRCVSSPGRRPVSIKIRNTGNCQASQASRNAAS